MAAPLASACIPRLAALLARPLLVVDVGCRWGAEERWADAGDAVRVVGFDPDEEECARLNAQVPDLERIRYVPLALGSREGPATLHLTAEPACSSLYPPDTELIEARSQLSLIEPVGQAQIHLARLDDWLGKEGEGPVDVMKLDTQGSELDVLEGATTALEEVRALEIEVELNPIYRGQPLFGDVDRFLRDRGFVLWRLGHLVHYGLPEGRSDHPAAEQQFFDDRPVPVEARGGQVYWGHAHYVRADMTLPDSRRPWQAALRDAVVTGLFGWLDLAGLAVDGAVEDAPNAVATDIATAAGTAAQRR